jgi:hypothetical protein
VLGALALGACRVPYRPLTPREAAVDGLKARVQKLAESGYPAPKVFASVRFDTGSAAGAAGPQAPPIASAWLAPEGSPRCSAGVKALENGAEPLSGDRAVRVLGFDRAAVDAAGLVGGVPTVLDVDMLPTDLGGPRLCLRLPVTDATAAPAWSARSRWFLGMQLRMLAPVAGAHDELGNGALFSFYGGVWLGAVRLRLDWLFGETSTEHPAPPGYGRPEAELLGGAASVEWFPLRLGGFGLGANVGYEWLWTDFAANAGTQEWNEYRFGPRGPCAMLRLARVSRAPAWPGFSNRNDGWAAGVDFTVARWQGPGGLDATFVGIGVGLDTGYWW